MRLQRFFKFSWILALAAGGVFGAAQAQEATAPAQPASPSVESPREPQLSMDEMAKEAKSILRAMDADLVVVSKMLGKAREERDIVKVLCLEDKLSQMEVTRKNAGERSESLQGAVRAQDKELAKHAFTLLTVLKERMAQLSAEANQCIGVEAGFVGDSQVTVDVDPTLPEDPSEYPSSPIIMIPPSCVSCVL
ncbi:MAG TPA: hypothetical protein PLJ27_10855 [Polyangiaceae bacterium]|jgi:hypothetical protein|nr:MAG: hypothetical protein BWY17_00681 [Deltaproteobacteria bacterium ADurb.Bin207]HNT00333.1 hypothetical protein [Polyangiaceae bacterium]HNZ21766.1 hypothetical protein [Polyangiaceae bacterium]HOD25027.1 hypothetical protein [Polyangiaceae bacterium]HOE51357.1 hypothetical protein [Polyangiaceae bacterium]